MTARKKTAKQDTVTLVEGKDVPAGKTRSQSMATVMTSSIFPVITTQNYMAGNEVELSDLLAEVGKQTARIHKGDLHQVESMLYTQALALEAMFTNLAHRAQKQETFKGIEVLTRLALKAQAQSRATLATIGDLKNPVQLIKQANIAHGHQQVNQYAGAYEHTRAGKNESAPNKLLEADHEKRLEQGAAGQAGRADSQLETVGALNRAGNT